MWQSKKCQSKRKITTLFKNRAKGKFLHLSTYLTPLIQIRKRTVNRHGIYKKVFRLILLHSILGIESKYVNFRSYITRDVIFLTTKSMSNNLWLYGSG